MTRPLRTFVLGTSIAVAVAIATATELQAAGVYSGASGFTAGAPDNPIPRGSTTITAWENSVVSYLPAPGVGSSFKNPATGIASLGELYNPLTTAGSPTVGLIGTDAPGSITLGFAHAIYNGPGADFAVFENGFTGANNTLFAEFAYVEVSSDGIHFARFDSISNNTAPASGSGAFAFYDVTNVYNLAGKNAANWGTPFDLNELANNSLVLGGFLDLGSIQYVRLVDVVGSGSILSSGSEIPGIAKDSQGHPILDNWVTTGSSGFDYVGLPTGAIGVVNSVPEPSALVIGACLTGLLLGRRRAVGRV